MNTLKKHIEKKEFSPIYLLYGEEDYLKKLYKDKLKTAIIGEDLTMNYNYYEGKNIDTSEVISQAQTLPFFNDKRLIIIENSELFKKQNDLADFIGSMPDTTYIIFVENQIDKRGRLYKQVNKVGTVSEMKGLNDKNLKIWIASILKQDNKRITQDTASYLLGKTGPDMENILNEVEKLTCYAFDRDIISKEDVDAVCTEQVEGKIFQMIDAIAIKDNDLALNLYYDLLSLREKPLSILFLLARHFTILIQVKDLLGFGYDKSLISKKAGIQPYFIGKYISQARKISKKALNMNLNLCTETEEGIKSGRQIDQLGVEVLIIQCTN